MVLSPSRGCEHARRNIGSLEIPTIQVAPVYVTTYEEPAHLDVLIIMRRIARCVPRTIGSIFSAAVVLDLSLYCWTSMSTSCLHHWSTTQASLTNAMLFSAFVPRIYIWASSVDQQPEEDGYRKTKTRSYTKKSYSLPVNDRHLWFPNHLSPFVWFTWL